MLLGFRCSDEQCSFFICNQCIADTCGEASYCFDSSCGKPLIGASSDKEVPEKVKLLKGCDPLPLKIINPDLKYTFKPSRFRAYRFCKKCDNFLDRSNTCIICRHHNV